MANTLVIGSDEGVLEGLAQALKDKEKAGSGTAKPCCRSCRTTPSTWR